jgi:hypothetical protein
MDFYASTYADVFGGVPRVVPPSGKGKEKKEAQASLKMKIRSQERW